jgi:hypothetical protein
MMRVIRNGFVAALCVAGALSWGQTCQSPSLAGWPEDACDANYAEDGLAGARTVIGGAVAYKYGSRALGHVGGKAYSASRISRFPAVGGLNLVLGPPHPAVVGAVAVDTYVLPKCAPDGCTQSSIFTMTDFNSPPRLRHYENYLPPMPYTHPPVYPPAVADISNIADVGQLGLPTGKVNIEQ